MIVFHLAAELNLLGRGILDERAWLKEILSCSGAHDKINNTIKLKTVILPVSLSAPNLLLFHSDFQKSVLNTQYNSFCSCLQISLASRSIIEECRGIFCT